MFHQKNAILIAPNFVTHCGVRPAWEVRMERSGMSILLKADVGPRYGLKIQLKQLLKSPSKRPATIIAAMIARIWKNWPKHPDFGSSSGTFIRPPRIQLIIPPFANRRRWNYPPARQGWVLSKGTGIDLHYWQIHFSFNLSKFSFTLFVLFSFISNPPALLLTFYVNLGLTIMNEKNKIIGVLL